MLHHSAGGYAAPCVCRRWQSVDLAPNLVDSDSVRAMPGSGLRATIIYALESTRILRIGDAVELLGAIHQSAVVGE